MGVSPMMNGVSDSSCLLRWHILHVVLLTPHSSVNYMDEANYSMDASYGGPIPRQDSDVAPGSYESNLNASYGNSNPREGYIAAPSSYGSNLNDWYGGLVHREGEIFAQSSYRSNLNASYGGQLPSEDSIVTPSSYGSNFNAPNLYSPSSATDPVFPVPRPHNAYSGSPLPETICRILKSGNHALPRAARHRRAL